MKFLLFSLLFVTTAFANPQNLTLTMAGRYNVVVGNPLTCDATVELRWKDDGNKEQDTTFALNAGQSVSCYLPFLKLGTELRAKSATGCSSSDWTRITVPITLAVATVPTLQLKREAGGILAIVSAKGVLEKSTDGWKFFTLGLYEKYALDRTPAEQNFYRLKVDGVYSKVYPMTFERKVYRVYNMAGQLVDQTADVARYQRGGYVFM